MFPNVIKKGSGVFVNKEGDIYEGEYKNDMFEGKGALKSRGGWYRGTFVQGEKCGKGVMNFNSGAGYDGEWAHNRFEGEGTYLWPDNKRYEGEWTRNSVQRQW